MQWYYANDGQRQGPVSAEEFAQRVAAGEIRPETLVWHAGLANWKPYADVAATPPAIPTAAVAPAPTAAAPTSAAASPLPSAAGANPFTSTHAAPVVALRYGGFWRRVLAKIIDGFITGIISWIILLPLMFVMLGSFGMFEPGAEPSPEQFGAMIGFQLMSIAIQMVIGVSYSLFFLRKFSATPGKMALGMQVRRPDGQPLSMGRIIGRYFAEIPSQILLGIGYLIVAFDAQKRGLHDHIADTRVVVVRD